MDCRCGGVVTTAKVILDSVAAQKSFPVTDFPTGYSKIHILHGSCTCGRYLVTFKALEKEKPKTITIF